MKAILFQLWGECKYRLFALLKVIIEIITVLLAWKYIGGAFALVLAIYVLIISCLHGLSRIRKQKQKIENELLNHSFGNDPNNA